MPEGKGYGSRPTNVIDNPNGERDDWRREQVKRRAEELAGFAPDYLSKIGEMERRWENWRRAEDNEVNAIRAGYASSADLCSRYNINESKVKELTDLGVDLKTVTKVIRDCSKIRTDWVATRKWHSIPIVKRGFDERVYDWDKINGKLDKLASFASELHSRDDRPDRVRLQAGASWNHDASKFSSMQIYQRLLNDGLLDDRVLGIGPWLKDIKADSFMDQYLGALNSAADEDMMGLRIYPIRSGIYKFWNGTYRALGRRAEAHALEVEISERIGFLTQDKTVTMLPAIESLFSKITAVDAVEKLVSQIDSDNRGAPYLYFKNLALYRDMRLLDERTLSLFETLGEEHTRNILSRIAIGKSERKLLLGETVFDNADKIALMPGNFFNIVNTMGQVPAELLEDKVVEYIKAVGPGKAAAYLKSCVFDLADSHGMFTNKRKLGMWMFGDEVLGTREFIIKISENWAHEYFNGLNRGYSTDVLTDSRVIDNKHVIGLARAAKANEWQDAHYFWALSTTKDFRLTQPEYINKVIGVGKLGGELLSAVGSSRDVDAMLSDTTITFVETLESISEKLAYVYLRTINNANYAALTSKGFFEFFAKNHYLLPAVLDALNAKESFGDHVHSEMSKHLSLTLIKLIPLAGRMPAEFEKVKSRLGDLITYGSVLSMLGYNASEEMEFLVRKGDRAYISRLMQSAKGVISAISDSSNLSPEVPFPLGNIPLISDLYRHYATKRMFDVYNFEKNAYITESKTYKTYKGLVSEIAGFRTLGVTPAQAVDAIDNCSSLLLFEKNLPEDIRKRIYSNLESMAKPASVKERELRHRYPDIFEYMDRHVAYARTSGSESPLLEHRKDIRAYISMCYGFGKELNLKSVKQEKQMLARGSTPKITVEYEGHMIGELARAASMARYSKFVEYTSVYSAMLRAMVGKEVREFDISPDLRNALVGYLTVSHNKDQLLRLIQAYATSGAEAANKWASNLEGNRRVIGLMQSKGTNLDRLNNFEVKFNAAKPLDFIEKNRIRIAMIYSEIMSLISQLGYDNLEKIGVKATGNLPADANVIYDSLMAISKEIKFTREQMLVMEDIRNHVKSINSSSGQLYVAENGAEIRFFVASDPLKKMQLGVGFASCLDIRNGPFSYGAVARAIDANSIVIFASKMGEEDVLARVSMVDTDVGLLVNSGFYENTVYDLSGKESGWISALMALSNSINRPILIPGRFLEAHQAMKAALNEYGFELKVGIKAKIDKAVCSYTYSDLYGGPSTIGQNGLTIAIEAYMIKPTSSGLRR